MTELSALTWNIRYLGHAWGGLRSSHDNLWAVADAIASHRPDVAALQEVESTSIRAGFASEQHSRLVEALHAALDARGIGRGYQATYFPAHRYGSGAATLYTTGLLVLVRDGLAVEDAAHVEVTHRRFRWMGQLKQSRLCAHVRVRTPGGASLDVFNTHLSLPAFLTRDAFRFQQRMGYGANQVAEIDAVLDFVRARRAGPALLVGDFNSLPGSPVYERVVQSGELVDGFAEHLGLDLAGRLAWATAGALGGTMALDHVFSSRDVHWLDFAGSHPYGAAGDFDGLSDHVPKLGRLSLPA